jgi:hypothetical protein
MTPESHNVNPGAGAEEMAALVDGEITDMQRIEELKEMLRGDTTLQAEHDVQREVKSLLAGLPEAEAPNFMQTRIMGEISSRRNMRRGKVWLPNWGAAAAAVALFGMGYGMAVQYGGQVARVAPMMVDSSGAVGTTAAPPMRLLRPFNAPDINPALQSGSEQYASEQYASDANAAFESIYAASNDVEIPAEADPWLREFIELGNEAHNYSRAMRLTHNLVSPDVSQAVLAVDSR